jgi:hypothetical protein
MEVNYAHTVHICMPVNRCTCVVMAINNEFITRCVDLNKSFNNTVPFIVFTGFLIIKLSVKARIVIAPQLFAFEKEYDCWV